MEEDAAVHRRGPWSGQEDEYLMQLVNQHGPLNWVRISTTLGSRTPKQCRERYHQNLKPSLNHEPITAEEGIQIERLVGEIGKRWAEIARRLHGRSDNAVKNWWNGSQNRRKRYDRRRNANAVGGEEYYRRSGSIGGAPLALPLPNPMQSPVEQHRQHVPWSEAPLPSPCSSESPDAEGYHYTTSPHRTVIFSRHKNELPPIRTLSGGHHVGPMPSGALPGFSSFDQQTGDNDAHRRQHLLTAPNSPIQQQPVSDKVRDSRISVSSLLH
ncbi:hypothetical protein MY11210_007924 [Beauveria gryllotalpidicola]